MDYFDWKGALDHLHSTFPPAKRQPVIGITGNFGEKGCELAEGYWRSVLEAGATPLIIPPYEDRDALLQTLEQIDALLLSGGADINPLFVGEEPLPELHSINPKRDLSELLLIRLAFDRQIPILGICRGIQMLSVALDGSVHQDIKRGMPQADLLKHSQNLPRECASHTVMVEKDSLLYNIFSTEKLYVNSFHHQAVREAGPHLRVSARSTDGVIEAVESTEHKPVMGVQWHPECFILGDNHSMMPLFEWLVSEARLYHEAKVLHHHMLTLDSHCDTPMTFEGRENDFSVRSKKALVDLHKMTEGRLDASIMVAYLPQKERDEETLLAVTARTNQLLTQVEKMVAANPSYVDLARTPADLYRLKSEGKKAIVLGIENGYAIGHDLSLLQHFRNRGVVYVTLCHNGDNDICDSARGNQEHGGLSAFGREVVREMNRLGLMIDLSHAAESTFWDVLQLSQKPVVCSHSSCRALCDHPRNLTDQQMQALAKQGGVMQVTMYEGFLRRDGKATILDAVEHINHAVSVMGIEHVGIGTDFDGDGGVPGFADASEVINLTRHLLRQGYTHSQLRMLWGENFLRVMSENQG